MNKLCLICLFIVIIIILFVILALINQIYVEKMSNVPVTEHVPETALYASPGLLQQYDYLKVPDFVRQYDYYKAYDPLEQPARRVPRHEIYPMYLRNMVDIPTRGYPDNFTQIGVLVKQGDPTKNEDNKILRLFGRQEYPGSERYEYYTKINSGNDQIKIPIDLRRRELYDDDVVYVKELKEHYQVSLYQYDAPRYYPDIL
jgi:hypothetical protein